MYPCASSASDAAASIWARDEPLRSVATKSGMALFWTNTYWLGSCVERCQSARAAYLMKETIGRDQTSSEVTRGHQWSSVVVSGHQWSSACNSHAFCVLLSQGRAAAHEREEVGQAPELQDGALHVHVAIRHLGERSLMRKVIHSNHDEGGHLRHEWNSEAFSGTLSTQKS